MFTDLTGSTQLSEELGDIAMRSLLKQHYDIIFPIIETNNGTLVKTMGDGTLSYFPDPADAVRAAIDIQRSFDQYNQDKNKITLFIRCGLNTGRGIVEKKDIYGDVVNVAQRFEALAKPKEILLSQETYDLIKDVEGFHVIFSQETHIKGKIGLQKVYRAFWDEKEIEEHKARPPAEAGKEYPNGAVTADIPTEWGGAPPTTETVKLNVEADATLRVEQEEKPPVYYDLAKHEMIIGRSVQADIHLPEAFVSRKHAKIYKEGKHFIEDLGSHIGTLCHGKKIAIREMYDGDEFFIGSVKLVFQTKKEEAEEQDAWADGSATMAFNASEVLSLVVEDKGEIVAHYGLSDRPMVIGRVKESDIRLENPLISRRHATVYKDGDSARIEDLGSNNGTYLNGKRISKAQVKIGDEIRIGPFSLKIVDPTRPILDQSDANTSLVTKLFSFLSKK